MKIAFVLYPDVTQLDFTGPLQVLSRLPEVEIHLVAGALEPLPTDSVLSLNPTVTFDECPQADILCVPGGFGTEQAIADEVLIGFLRQQALGAQYVTSVCTGAFILGAAGLLEGKKATTHWAYRDALSLVGAIPTRGRVVRDGNIFTGGGVTAGIDFALTLVAEIAGSELAQSIQLGIEYDPGPPYDAGAPERAPEQVAKRLNAFYGARMAQFTKSLEAVMAP